MDHGQLPELSGDRRLKLQVRQLALALLAAAALMGCGRGDTTREVGADEIKSRQPVARANGSGLKDWDGGKGGK